MKKNYYTYLIPLLLVAAGGCNDYDDSKLWEELSKLQSEQKLLADKQEAMNGNVAALQGIVNALQSNDYVTGVTHFTEPAPGGYYIDFAKSDRATIYNGATQIGVKDSADGNYYWTLNGGWLIDNAENKIPVTGANSATPKLRVNPTTNKWEVCATGACADDAEWTSTGVNATGPQGDAIFAPDGVDNSNPDYVEFTLADNTTIKVQKYKEFPRFLSFGFGVSKNSPAFLNVICSVEDNTLFVVVPHEVVPTMLQRKLVPNFTFEGDSVVIGNERQDSGKDSVDFSSSVEYTVKLQEKSKTYTVKVLSSTGLPIVSVNTENQAPILSKDDYVNGNIRILGDRTATVFSDTMRIKGRGNATWTYYDKKPYRIKLDKKSEVLGMPADKDWVLLAEYTDKSLLRNTYAFEMSKVAGLEWTPRMRHVEFFENGIYQGTYLLGEHVKVASSRAQVNDDGYMIELDGAYLSEPIYFATERGHYYTFKHPDADDISKSDPAYSWIKSYMNEFESALYGDNFKDPSQGYRKYIDVESFALWFLIQETLGNIDTNPYFVLKSPSSKLKMYPVWDFEWCLGNAAINPEPDPNSPGWNGWLDPPATSPIDAYYWKTGIYFHRLFEDPYFIGIVKEKWQQLKLGLPAMKAKVEEETEIIRYAQKENFNRWQLLGKYIDMGSNYTGKGPDLLNFATWEEHTVFIKTFFKQRVAWIDAQISSW